MKKLILLFVLVSFWVSTVSAQETKKSNSWFWPQSVADQQTLPDLGFDGIQPEEQRYQPDAALQEEVLKLATSISESGVKGAGAYITQSLKNHIAQAILPDLDLPDWAERVEVQFDLETKAGPVYSVRTVQPLYQSDDKVDTIFTQLRYARHSQFGLPRHTSNFGLGYRRLLLDNTLLLGANLHYDREWRRNHNRLGIGLEGRWYGADVYLNRYQGLSKVKTITSSLTEEIVDGWDIRTLFQVPYVPSVRVVATGSRWKIGADDHLNGWKAGVEADLTQYTQIQLGAADDNDQNDTEFYVTFRISPGWYGHKRPVLLSSAAISDTAWQMRDMSGFTLDRVRREDNIRLKQTTANGAVTISISRN